MHSALHTVLMQNRVMGSLVVVSRHIAKAIVPFPFYR